MDRKTLIRHPFTRDSRLIEIGASYSPIVPKSEGWNTTIVDHADQPSLRAKYRDMTPENIEPVDYVWTEGPLDALIPESQHGTFDGLIASHVGEHMPDLIGFFHAMDRVLAPQGIIALALPDLRTCFDFFRPHSTTGDLLDARGRMRHRPGKVFDNIAYQTNRNGVTGWAYGLSSDVGGQFQLSSDLRSAYDHYTSTGEQVNDPYTDAHGWCFTPSSFHLNIIELFSLDVIPWTISRIDPSGGVEFYVWLERRRLKMPDAELASLRLRLLQDTITESEEQLLQLRPSQRPAFDPPPVVPESAPVLALAAPSPLSVTAIIPLYNGGKFIVRALQSILAQTVKPKELFVVDDGSTDHGDEIVKVFIDNRRGAHALDGIDFKLFYKENGGQSSARNFGVKHATGDLIGFLDQDDEWYAMHIEKLRQPFLDNPPGSFGWVYSNLDHADVNGKVLFRNWLPASEHPKTDLFKCLSRDMFVLPSASLISRSVFNEVGGFDTALSGYEDDDLFSRIFQSYDNFFLNESLSKWCIHHDSSSYSYRMRRSRDRFAQKLLTNFPDDPDRTIYYARDLILPRFYPHSLVEFRKALVSGDMAQITETLQSLRVMLFHASSNGIHNMISASKARRLSFIMKFITPNRARRLYAVRQALRPITRILSPLLRGLRSPTVIVLVLVPIIAWAIIRNM